MLHCKILFTEGLKRIEINLKVSCLRACLHGGGGPYLSCQRDQIKAAGLPHLPGVPHLHVNRPQVHKQIQFTSHLSVTCLGTE